MSTWETPMPHFVSKLGDLLRFHPLAHLQKARKASDIPGRAASADAPGKAKRPDDLSHLCLRVEPRASDSCCDLGRFGLIAADDVEHRARVVDLWKSVD
jgi:hypothetical protein